MIGSKLVVGIDPGLKNFAWVVLRSNQHLRPVVWKKEELLKPKYSHEAIQRAIYKWIKSTEVKDILDRADEIVIETQISRQYDIIVHCVKFLYFEKTKIVHPSTVSSLFNLPKGRKEKKKAAVDLVSSKLPLPVKKGKKDDLCDAYLLALSRVTDSVPDFTSEWIKD